MRTRNYGPSMESSLVFQGGPCYCWLALGVLLHELTMVLLHHHRRASDRTANPRNLLLRVTATGRAAGAVRPSPLESVVVFGSFFFGVLLSRKDDSPSHVSLTGTHTQTQLCYVLSCVGSMIWRLDANRERRCLILYYCGCLVNNTPDHIPCA
jgi:hypothetical protein